ncbi:MAG: xanthine dehydrogenase family protein molybdopterin-binding subunit [Chloroflexi bacterium]|nr:xanthine dehydrogenase family protein molybdopterin-binding subunit [Chloroflexota bacterium]
MTTTADRPTTQYKVVGTRPIRHDGVDKVTGRAKYGADVTMPGLLYGAIVRSPHAHARIKRIDTSKAASLPGVKAIITAADLPIADDKPIDLAESMGNVRILAENALASKKVLYKGHALAAIAATSPHTAEEAAQLVHVEYEVLPPVLSVDEAMKPGAPVLHEQMTMRKLQKRFTRGEDSGVKGNVGSHWQIKLGDVEAGFREADVVVEREFRTRPVHQGYIEPHNTTAFWSADGRVTVWTSTQGPFGVRAQVAAVLGIPESQVRIIPMEIGGGFGGKINSYFDHIAAMLSKKSGHHVKIVMSRREVFEASGPTSGSWMKCKIGAKKDGRLTAAWLWMAFEAGAFPGSPVGAAATTALTPYKLENALVDAFDVVVNKPKVAAYRAPGSPQGAFAVETVIDELAEKLKMDPMEFRLKNATGKGDRMVTGIPLPEVGCVDVEQAIKKSAHYNAPVKPSRPGLLAGRGVAMGYWGNAGMQSSATVSVNADGSVSLVTGSVDIGGTRAACAMQVAEVLGLTAKDVIPSVGDTDSVGWTGVTGGSRTAFSTGIASITASERVRDELKRRAATMWEVMPDEVAFKDGVFINLKKPDERLAFKQLAAKSMGLGGPVTASASSNPKQIAVSFAALLVDVEVDPETGKVDATRVTAFQDVGQPGHPSYVEGQMQGGTVQGLGWALNEEYVYDPKGMMQNPSYLDYRMPTALDLPMIDTVMVTTPAPGHPFGLRGVGEVSIVPPMGAVANAVHNAIGVRVTELPITPGVILKALASKKR